MSESHDILLAMAAGCIFIAFYAAFLGSGWAKFRIVRRRRVASPRAQRHRADTHGPIGGELGPEIRDRGTSPTYDFDQGFTAPSMRGFVDETRLPLVLVPRRNALNLAVDSPWNPDGDTQGAGALIVLTQTVSGVPRMVWPGPRTHVVMWSGAAATSMFYTWDQFRASLCERAYHTKRSITIQAEQTRHGWRIAHVGLDAVEARP